MPEHYEEYSHDTTYDYQVKQYGERCGYTYKLESILNHGSIAFKCGVIVEHDRFLAGRRVCRIIRPDGTHFNSSIGLLEDIASLLPNGMDDVQGDWNAIAIRCYGEEGTIDDLLTAKAA